MQPTRANHTSYVIALILAAAALAAVPAAAQEASPPPPATLPAGEAAPAAPASGDVQDPWWEFIAGFEADTHGTGYGFAGPAYVHPIRPNLAVTGRVFASYLYYEFEEAGGTTSVRSPGVSPMLGLRFGSRSFFQVLAGPDIRWREEEFEAGGVEVETEDDGATVGASIAAEAYTNPSDRDVIHGIVTYGTVDEYVWGRLGYKRQLTNLGWQGSGPAWFLGVEVTGQGNDDIRSFQVGPMTEVVFSPSNLSLSVRAGYKKSTFDAAPDRDGPYFGVGLYKRF